MRKTTTQGVTDNLLIRELREANHPMTGATDDDDSLLDLWRPAPDRSRIRRS